MRICFVYNEKAYGRHRKALGFDDVEGLSLTGSDLAFAKHAEHLRQRGHEVVCYVPRVVEHKSPEGLVVRNVDRLPEDLKTESFDAAVAITSPDDLRHFPETTFRTVNRQCGPFGNDCAEGWQEWVDLVTSPSQDAADRVGEQLRVPVEVVANGCDSASYWTEELEGVERVPGRVVYLSAPDRGLHLLLQAWPQIKQAYPAAHLRIFYYALHEYLDQHARRDSVGGEDARRAHYVKHAIERLRDFGVEAVGGVTHRQLARELREAVVFCYPCDPSSYTETFSVATLEACAAGCVPVISGADSLGSLYGEILPESIVQTPAYQHVDEVVQMVAGGLTNPSYQASVVNRALLAAAERFDWKVVSQQYERILSYGVLAKHSAPADRVAQFEMHTTEMSDNETKAWGALAAEFKRGDAAWVPTTEEHLDAAETSCDPAVFTAAEKPCTGHTFVDMVCKDCGKKYEDCSTWEKYRSVHRIEQSTVPPTPKHPLGFDQVVQDITPKQRTVHLVLSSYASGGVPIDIDDPYYESEGGGCRSGFMGLVRALGKIGTYKVRAFSTFKATGTRDGVEYCSVDRSSLTVGKPDALLAYYDCRPLAHVEGCLRIASHHTFNLGPWAGALEWADVNVAPCQYVVDALRPVYDETGAWHVLPNASVEIPRVCERVPGRVIYHTSASRGLHHLVSMWPQIRAAVPHATLHVVGGALQWCEQLRGKSGRSGERANQILRDLPAAKAAGGIEFTGFLPRRELVRELCEAEVFAFPSTTVTPSETFSVSILECLKVGCAVVLSPCDALWSIWNEGGVEMVDPMDLHEDFVPAVVEVLTDHQHRARLIQDGHKRAVEFTFERSAKQLDKILRKHLGGEAEKPPTLERLGMGHYAAGWK